jgi:hypothetical protein
MAPMAAQEAPKMPPAAVEAAAPPCSDDMNMAAPVAAQKVGKASQMAVDNGVPPERKDERIAAPLVT